VCICYFIEPLPILGFEGMFEKSKIEKPKVGF
jgi:hypothetical protein